MVESKMYNKREAYYFRDDDVFENFGPAKRPT